MGAACPPMTLMHFGWDNMRGWYHLYISLLAGLVFQIALPERAMALNYVDEAGNIHFIDSLEQVPPRYKHQLVRPKPVPVDKRGRPIVPKKSEEQLEKERELKRVAIEEKRELKARQKKLEREQDRIRRQAERITTRNGIPLAASSAFNRGQKAEMWPSSPSLAGGN